MEQKVNKDERNDLCCSVSLMKKRREKKKNL